MRQALELSQHQERPYADIFRGQAGGDSEQGRLKNFIAMLNVTDGAGAQLLMAKITSHFKHGTERVSRSKIRNRAGQ